MKILLLEPGKVAREAEIDGSLESMQETVGGLITAVYLFSEPVAVVANDEGLLMGLPLNRKLDDYTIIAGTCFLCGLSDDSFADLPPELMEKFKRQFYYPHLFLKVGDELVALPCNPSKTEEGEQK